MHGLALAGGGPQGAIYELGALCALERCIEGFDANELSIYVGVSAGSFIASCLANRVTPEQMCRAIAFGTGAGEHPIHAEHLFTPAAKEMFRGGFRVPRLFFESLTEYFSRPEDLSLLESLTRLSRALPVGLFDNEPLRSYLGKIFALRGRTDDFRKLGSKLIVVAADLDSGRAVRFGEPGSDEVPISKAVQASTALPGLYPPVRIGDRYYVDGALLKTLHASVALEAGVSLLFCINPIVPVDTTDAVEGGRMEAGDLIARGLPSVLSQTFRTLIHSRLQTGLAAYGPRFPGADIVLLEPRRGDVDMFFRSAFSFSSRRAVCEHAYETTREDLRSRRAELEPVLARHGMAFREDGLVEETGKLRPLLGLNGNLDGAPVTAMLERALSRIEEIVAEGQAEPPLSRERRS